MSKSNSHDRIDIANIRDVWPRLFVYDIDPLLVLLIHNQMYCVCVLLKKNTSINSNGHQLTIGIDCIKNATTQMFPIQKVQFVIFWQKSDESYAYRRPKYSQIVEHTYRTYPLHTQRVLFLSTGLSSCLLNKRCIHPRIIGGWLISDAHSQQIDSQSHSLLGTELISSNDIQGTKYCTGWWQFS